MMEDAEVQTHQTEPQQDTATEPSSPEEGRDYPKPGPQKDRIDAKRVSELEAQIAQRDQALAFATQNQEALRQAYLQQQAQLEQNAQQKAQPEPDETDPLWSTIKEARESGDVDAERHAMDQMIQKRAERIAQEAVVRRDETSMKQLQQGHETEMQELNWAMESMGLLDDIKKVTTGPNGEADPNHPLTQGITRLVRDLTASTHNFMTGTARKQLLPQMVKLVREEQKKQSDAIAESQQAQGFNPMLGSAGNGGWQGQRSGRTEKNNGMFRRSQDGTLEFAGGVFPDRDSVENMDVNEAWALQDFLNNPGGSNRR